LSSKHSHFFHPLDWHKFIKIIFIYSPIIRKDFSPYYFLFYGKKFIFKSSCLMFFSDEPFNLLHYYFSLVISTVFRIKYNVIYFVLYKEHPHMYIMWMTFVPVNNHAFSFG